MGYPTKSLKSIGTGIAVGCLLVSIIFASNNAAAKDSSWLKISVPAQRFAVLSQFGNAAVLDRETGLVWEQCPSEATLAWANAMDHCFSTVIGNRRGWRLPTFDELASLEDRDRTELPFLPNSGAFCSATVPRICTDPTDLCDDSSYWTATPDSHGSANHPVIVGGKEIGRSSGDQGRFRAWCVRGGK